MAARGGDELVGCCTNLPTIILLLLLACLATPAQAESQKKWLEDLEAWHQRRIASLTRADGWLSLAGLYWLKEGLNSLSPDHPATYRVEAGQITLLSPNGLVRVGDQYPRQFEFDLQEPEGKTLCHWGSQSWYLIQRDGRWGIRLKDTQNPPLIGFQGIPRYPADAQWRFSGRFQPYPSGHKLVVPNVLGTTSEEDCPGAVFFQYQGKTHRLEPTREKDGSLFFVFGDTSNGRGSYGAGRFLLTPPPDANGFVDLDFNRSYNPPCAFTDFATCPRPPAGNRLPFAVEAGEKAPPAH